MFPLTSDIIKYYIRCSDKKKTSDYFGITVKELNRILRFAKKGEMNNRLADIGMSQNDFVE